MTPPSLDRLRFKVSDTWVPWAGFVGLYLITFIVALKWTDMLVLNSAPLIIATPALIVLSVIDFRSNRIPDYCSLLLGVVGVWVAFQNNVLFMNLVVAVFLGGLLWAVSEWYFRSYKVEALGLGDVKLMIALTIWLGPQKFSTMLFLASVAGVALLLYQRNKSIPGRSTIVSPSSIQPTVPFGPLLAYSFFLTILTNTP